MTTLNFVWVGKPRFEAGGDDVIGPDTIAANFQKFSPDNPPATMNFWCQAAYQEAYETYFRQKGVPIQVISIEDRLNQDRKKGLPASEGEAAVVSNSASASASASAAEPAKFMSLEELQAQFLSEAHDRKQAERVYQHFMETMSAPDSTTRDSVSMKDMMSFYVLANSKTGGYFLDTNVHAGLNAPAIFNDYTTFKSPAYLGRRTSIPEVWMQYSPADKPLAAKLRLDNYLDRYDERRDLINNGLWERHSQADNRLGGFMVTDAITLSEKIGPEFTNKGYQRQPKFDKSILTSDERGERWYLGDIPSASKTNCVQMKECGDIAKAHSGSHYIGDIQQKFTNLHYAILEKNFGRLQSLLEHKANANEMSFQPGRNGTISKTPLCEVVGEYCNTLDASYIPIIQELLKYGADPNQGLKLDNSDGINTKLMSCLAIADDYDNQFLVTLFKEKISETEQAASSPSSIFRARLSEMKETTAAEKLKEVVAENTENSENVQKPDLLGP